MSVPTSSGSTRHAGAAPVRALLGHASLGTGAHCFRAGSRENTAVVERVLGQ
ncbi:hypothetical protein HNR06_005071 [Nocardiopsis arvandica]|uniref:Uncharacterized protein n=1 Tax=Nocardiopsis sinuspersici TaxID=501010 RepID=A0A7Y9XIT8_9ACTN|nr:hypothetical protein [Nocardiopsis sinuspersici]NYH55482.1 hypothetical protein [Nocardiopsis sinuspersici]